MKLLINSLISLFSVLALSLPVSAASGGTLSIPVSTIVRGDVSSQHVLATKNVDQSLIGMVCDIMATGQNQGSVHPDNDIVITSGSGNVTLADVERAANAVTHADGQLTLGNKIVVTLELGKDKVFSGGMSLDFNCDQPKQIEVCRDGQVITIDESDKLQSDTNPPCPTEQVQVCREGKIVTIDIEDRKNTDTDAPCVLGEKHTPKELPNTGIESVIGGAFGTGAMGWGIKSWLESRSMLRTGMLRKKED